jgi:hypothetical protein
METMFRNVCLLSVLFLLTNKVIFLRQKVGIPKV